MTLDREWQAAAEDAGVDPSAVVLYPLEAREEYGAVLFHAGVTPPGDDPSFAYTEADLLKLHGELRDRHVIVLDLQIPDPQRRLVLRHEAEHVAQWEASPAAADFALQLAIAREPDWLYLAMPHERDADAAATAFRHAQGIETADGDLVGRHRMLYDAPWPATDRASLPIRLLAFSLFYADDFDIACKGSQYWPSVDPTELTEKMIPGGAPARERLRSSVSGWLKQVTDHGITREEWESMAREERNVLTDRLRAEVVAREEEIVRELHEEFSH